MDAKAPSRDLTNAPRSAKNHTCYFWAQGGCKYSEEECLYAHRATGKTANQPVRLEPGRPAVAGRNLLAADPQHFNWRRLQHQYPSTASQGPDEDMKEEGEITPNEQQQDLMADIQRRALHHTRTHSQHSAASNAPKPWQAAGFDAVTTENIAVRAQGALYGDIEMDDSGPTTATDPFTGQAPIAGPSTSRRRTTDVETQLRRLKRAYAAQGAMLEKSLSALEIGQDIVAEERTVLFHLSRGVIMRQDPRAVRSGPPSQSIKDVVEKMDRLMGEYGGVLRELRERQEELGRDVEGLW